MLEVKIPAEIRDYKGKLIAGLTVRQVVAIGGALAVSVPIALLGKGHIPGDILPWFVIISVAPFAAWGFMSYKGMKFEDFARVFFAFTFWPQRRVYEDADVNYLCALKEGLSYTDALHQRYENGELDEEDLFTYIDEWRDTDGQEG